MCKFRFEYQMGSIRTTFLKTSIFESDRGHEAVCAMLLHKDVGPWKEVKLARIELSMGCKSVRGYLG